MIKKSLKSKTSKSHTWAPLRNSCVFQKIRRIYKILALYKKIMRIYRILALYKKSGGFIKSLRLQKHRRTIESLWVFKSPHMVKKPAGLEKTGSPLTV
jgi:hypothetical protein